MKKIVALTGSFNPVTRAHFSILSDAVNQIGADEGVFVITDDKYLRAKTLVKNRVKSNFILSEEVRGEMLQSLNAENPKITFWGKELGGLDSQTCKTLIKLKKSKEKQYHDEVELYFLFGADKLRGVPNWRNAEELMDLCHYLVYSRQVDIGRIIDADSFLFNHRNRIHEMTVQNEDLDDVSSTEVRRRFFAGEDYRDLMNVGPWTILQRFTPADFPPVTGEDLVRAQFLYGGHFGKNAGRKQVCINNTALLGHCKDKQKHSEVKIYDQIPGPVSSAAQDVPTVTTCVNADCVDVAEQLIRDGLRPVILNHGSAVTPCGGYHEGIAGQEETLACRSTLSLALYRFEKPNLKRVRELGVEHVPGTYPMDINFGGIYVPHVTFFRDGESNLYALRQSAFECPVVTVPSLAFGGNKYRADNADCFSPDGTLNDKGTEIEMNKIRTIFRIALDNGHDSVVLGALGCGAGHVIPGDCAKLFRTILDEPEFKNKFKKLVFAIYEGTPSPRKAEMGKDGKYKPFYNFFA